MREPQRTMVSSICCPVCHTRRIPTRDLSDCDWIIITCSPACHVVWWRRLVALLADCPDVANHTRLVRYYARREVVPAGVIERVVART